MRYNLAFVCVSGIDSGLKIICLFSFLFVEWIFADFRLYYYKMRYNLASEPVCRGTRASTLSKPCTTPRLDLVCYRYFYMGVASRVNTVVIPVDPTVLLISASHTAQIYTLQYTTHRGTGKMPIQNTCVGRGPTPLARSTVPYY